VQVTGGAGLVQLDVEHPLADIFLLVFGDR